MRYINLKRLFISIIAFIFVVSLLKVLPFVNQKVSTLISYQAKIIKVADGDTFTAIKEHEETSFILKWLHPGFGEKIIFRLYGVDCPEKNQPYGLQASAITKALNGHKVTIEPAITERVNHTDQYGRTVAIIRLENGITLQELLLNSGSAWLYPQFCKMPICDTWKNLEIEAKNKHLGLWAEGNPTAPWQWRKHEHSAN